MSKKYIQSTYFHIIYFVKNANSSTTHKKTTVLRELISIKLFMNANITKKQISHKVNWYSTSKIIIMLKILFH